MQISRHHVGPRMTQMVIRGEPSICAGRPAEGIEGAGAQTRAILAKIDTLLAEAGSSKSKLRQVQIWLADIRYYDEMNAVWDAWVDPANTPGRATCEARMVTPRVLVEIIVIAARRGSAQANSVREAQALTLRLTLESELALD
jgi:enamine deaminase RidA (YjgF/YER057c/UK114 family)